MTQTEITYPNEQALAQKALEHVRAVFRGNGIKIENITIKTQKITQHTMNAGTYLELKPILSERSSPGKTVAGHLSTSREEVTRTIDQTMIKAASDTAMKAQIANVLLSRSDQGFGLNRQAVPLGFLEKEFTWHEACQTCRGSARAPCIKCQGRRLETCVKCIGRGLMKCPMCRATGLLQGNKCPRCHAQRYVACDGCQRSGMMPCRTCSATGVMKCQTCAGQGWKSHVITLKAQGLTYFEYDAKSVPKGAADSIETNAVRLAHEKIIKIKGRVADDKENALGASYEVSFPYGEIEFTLGKKDIKINLFGYKAELVEFPNILDKLLAPMVAELEDAANNKGDVAKTIQKATRFRLIAQAFLLTHKLSNKKTAAQLLKTFDIGLSIGLAERLAYLADATSSLITRKPRYYGLGLGLLLMAFVNALYYLLPVRSSLASALPTIKIDFILDILPVILGGLATTLTIQLMAAGAIRKALGHLTSKDKKSTLMPKAKSIGWWGYGGALVITLGMIELSALRGNAPHWYEFLSKMVGL